MAKHLSNMEAFHQIINNNQLVVVHVMRDHCSVCHAVLPQIEDIVASYPNVKLAVINQSDVEVIAGELSIFTVPVDLIFMNGKRNASSSTIYRYATLRTSIETNV